MPICFCRPCIALQPWLARCPGSWTSALYCRWVPWSRSIARRLVACMNISRSAHLSQGGRAKCPISCIGSCSQG